MKPEDFSCSSAENKFCPQCAEPVRINWKVCPVCETPLTGRICPGCGAMVKENWDVCPQCNVQLICPSCEKRIPDASRQCPHCNQEQIETPPPQSVFIDPLTGMEFVYVAGGRFQMGDIFGDGMDDEMPVHTVRIAEFYLGKFPVSQGQWRRVMKSNPAMFQRGERYPVEQVRWADVCEFIAMLRKLNNGQFDYRLPTEAEWEYAARSGGRDERFSGSDDARAVAWYDENSDGSTHPVGCKRSNGLGLHDMSGNVWEWCLDGYDRHAYCSHASANPLWTASTAERVIRGGSWNLDAWSARCTRRMGYPVDYCGPGLGLRLVRVIQA